MTKERHSHRPSIVPRVLLLALAGSVATESFPERHPPSAGAGDDRVAAAAQAEVRADGGDGPSASTRRMVRRLKDLADRADILQNPYLSDRRVERLLEITPPGDPARRIGWDLMVAREHLRAGLNQEAVARLEVVLEGAEAVPAWRDLPIVDEARSLLAVAHLRVGEQRNCIRHHTAESCILPIRGHGVHQDPSGSRAAIEELSGLLLRNPEDLRSRWLLNVAYMTLGEHPQKVPPQWLIPPSAFASEYDVGRFENVAAEIGLDAVGLAGGSIMDDFDGDGHLDVLLTSWGLRDQLRLFRNRGDGKFEDITAEAGLTGIVGGLNAVQADYDNDGDLDVFVPRGAWFKEQGRLPPSLLRNRGDGRFDDVTEEAGLLSLRPTQAATWGDYDNDGWIDLYVAGESTPRSRYPNQLYRNDRDGTFTDVAGEAGVAAVGFFKGAVWGDYDNDGRQDLYLTALHTTASNLLFHNDGPDAEGRWRFSEVGGQAGVRGPPVSFPAWFFDYDNDGWLDLFVSGYGGSVAEVAADYLGIAAPAEADTPHLYRNQGDGTFRDVTEQTRLDRVVPTMGCNFGDLDNDGWLDFYLGTGNPDFRTLIPNRMFRNAGGEYFQDVTTSGGFGHLQKGHGISFGDLDNDGDQDVLLKAGGAFTGDTFQSALFENPGHGNRWIGLVLVGDVSNRAAVGARVKVTVQEADRSRDIYATVSSGSSFGSSPLRREIGLGEASRIRRIEITWPGSGRRQVLDDVPLDGFFEIREGAAAARRLPLEKVVL